MHADIDQSFHNRVVGGTQGLELRSGDVADFGQLSARSKKLRDDDWVLNQLIYDETAVLLQLEDVFNQLNRQLVNPSWGYGVGQQFGQGFTRVICLRILVFNAPNTRLEEMS